jgi:hypothetical protein
MVFERRIRVESKRRKGKQSERASKPAEEILFQIKYSVWCEWSREREVASVEHKASPTELPEIRSSVNAVRSAREERNWRMPLAERRIWEAWRNVSDVSWGRTAERDLNPASPYSLWEISSCWSWLRKEREGANAAPRFHNKIDWVDEVTADEKEWLRKRYKSQSGKTSGRDWERWEKRGNVSEAEATFAETEQQNPTLNLRSHSNRALAMNEAEKEV